MSLTDIKVRQAHCKEKTCFLSDEDGLSLKIEPSGRKSWCYRYTDPQTKKRRRIQLGLYPDLSLKKARQVRDDFKDNNFCLNMILPLILSPLVRSGGVVTVQTEECLQRSTPLWCTTVSRKMLTARYLSRPSGFTFSKHQAL
ncbi:hypothetical protein J622_03334 [Acinetobacter sp. 1564232]|nr:hypothetical protein J622_03334 [Acinetobacter sp. 1564232]